MMAAVAAFLLWSYVNTADERARADAEPVEVWVSSGAIPQGMTMETALARDLIELAQVPSVNRPADAIVTLEQISGLATLYPVLSQVVLQQGMWGDPTSIEANFDVDEGQVALSLQVGVPEGVSGFLDQGDQIGIIAHIDAQLPSSGVALGPDGGVVTATEPQEVSVTTSQYVTDAEVLAVGQRVDATPGEAGGNSAESQPVGQVLVTVSVSPEDAERLVFATNEGAVYFTLLPDGGESGDTPGTQFDTLFDR